MNIGFLHWTARTSLGSLVLLITSGCVMGGTYPAHWASTQSSQTVKSTCPDISGNYSNQSVEHHSLGPTFSEGYLSAALSLPTDETSAGHPQCVTISQPSETKIKVNTSNGREFELDADKGHFSCSDGSIKINPKHYFEVDGMVTADATFSRARNRALVMRLSVPMQGVLPVAPVAGALLNWVHWERVGQDCAVAHQAKALRVASLALNHRFSQVEAHRTVIRLVRFDPHQPVAGLYGYGAFKAQL